MTTTRRPFDYRISGLDPRFVEKQFASLPKNGKLLSLERNYGCLRNVGMGPAIETKVVWVPEEVTLKDEEFTIDAEKLSKPRYGRPCNTLPAVPRILPPGSEAQLTRIPTFLALDFDETFTSISGYIEINYRDITRRMLTTKQAFHIWSSSDADTRQYGVTFGDVHELPAVDEH